MLHRVIAQHVRGLAPSPPPPLVLLAVQRAAAGVALALPIVGMNAITSGGGGSSRSLSMLNEWLAIYTTALVVLLAARVAAAVHRWRLGHSDLLELVHTARSLVAIACSFLLPASHQATHTFHTQQAQFVADLKRLVLAYVALALQECRGERHEIPHDQLRHLLDDANEMAELRRSETNSTRAAVVELWLRTRLSRACFSDTSVPLIPHAVQTMELHRVVSTLPVLYDSAVRAWSQPPQWRVLTVHTPPAIFGYVVLFTVVHTPTTAALVLVLWVFCWGLALFAMDAVAGGIESRFTGTAEGADPLEQSLLDMQDAIDAAAHAFFRSSGGVNDWERCHRSVPSLPRRLPIHIPRTTSSIAPASPRRSPHSGVGGSSYGHDGGDGLGKPSLKHMLDMITTSAPSPSLSTSATVQAGSAAERRPLLLQQGSEALSVPRYDLFLRRDDESSHGESGSDMTDVADDEGTHDYDHGDLSV